MWDSICAHRYGVTDPKLRRFRYGMQVNSLGLTEEQPENNVQRIVLEMLGVTLSKDARARAIQLPCWNEAIGLPTPWDQQWSLRIQQVLAFESDLLEYDDLFEGSKVVEAKVAELIAEAEAELQWVLDGGGSFAMSRRVHSRPSAWVVTPERFGSWTTLQASLLRIVNGGMSAATAPVFDLGIYANAPEELKTRARQLGSLVARVTGAGVETSGFRKQLDTFFGSYVAELQDRGFPVWHPLPFQFPEDAEGARHADEFLLGDEMLIAPLYAPGDRRSVYLPRGIWTNLETNEVTVGPRTLDVETKSLPVWSRNGAIVPLDSRNGIALHYFPKLGGEFFLLEGDIADYSQVHAAPALDFIRLEIESKKEREYQWVVHHVDRPASLDFEDRKYREVKQPGAVVDGTWFYDAAQRNLQVRAKVKAGEDCIINVSF
jgi:hypothetical protein